MSRNTSSKMRQDSSIDDKADIDIGSISVLNLLPHIMLVALLVST